MMNRCTVVLGSAAAAVLLAATPASSATTVADWRMDESSGRQMRDGTGRHPGTLGADVRLLRGAYQFPYVSTTVYRPAHLVSVPDGPGLDPGAATWSVTTRLKFTRGYGNVLQKGQAGAGRTFFKLEAPRGIVSCLFRGSAGSVSVNSGTPLNNGAWHTITCRRAGEQVTMTIDGTRTRRGTGATGTISNSLPFAIGGKSQCNAGTVSCDYWVGEMDYARVVAG